MAHDITLKLAAESAHQAELICTMLKDFQLTAGESDVMLTLLKRLSGEVAAWLIEEQYQKETKTEDSNHE